ncbi:hypothetical protein FOYG_08748 [Fusarium oxysporum NRRL 32931]|uniref:Uncharacterized protein n=1 Tax=Fusarium oxysporum NRRL 32931 TaxID=660029 RepID=W9IA60_FUSOX|nr:hypothetical protein FOYG_08748 [Fusarium oxysporum NRRL 32931]
MVTTQHAYGALFSCVAGQKPHELGSSRPSASVTPGADALVVSKSSQYQFVLKLDRTNTRSASDHFDFGPCLFSQTLRIKASLLVFGLSYACLRCCSLGHTSASALD